jgi:hypothetical protein
MKKWALLILLAVVMTFAADCLVTYPLAGPPPRRVEVIPASPGHGFVWIEGYWRWSGNAYFWVPGHHVKARSGYVWVPGYWQQKGRHWIWREGHWRRGR